jgi:hypothetical protein
VADFLTTLQHFESGGRNIPNVHQGTSSGQAQGFNQITTGTWKEFGGLAYAPTPLQATQEQQNAIAAKIPLKRWAPETLAYLRNNGFTLNPNATLAENIAINHGTLGTAPSPHGTTLTSNAITPPHTLTPPTAGAPYTPEAIAAANPPAAAQPPQNVGDWLKKIATKPPPTKDAQGNDVEQKSPLQKVADRFATPANAAPPEIPPMPAMYPAQDPTAQLAGPSQQLFSAVSAAAAKPLSWSSAPYGSGAGQLGTTLNSVNPYG